MRPFLSCTIFLSLTVGSLSARAVSLQSKSQVLEQEETAAGDCSQPANEQAALIREAEAKQYTTRRVEFSGNRYTGDTVLRRRFVMGLQEGDRFSRRNYIKSLRNVSKLKMIYPVRPRDVVLRLNSDEKTIDIRVCFRERRRPQRR